MSFDSTGLWEKVKLLVISQYLERFNIIDQHKSKYWHHKHAQTLVRLGASIRL